MSSDLIPQNPTPEENSIPSSPQELTELIEPEGSSEPERPAPENTAHSEPSTMPPVAPESSGSGFTAESNNIPLSNSIPLDISSEQKQAENRSTQALHIEPNQAELTQTSEPVTPQTSINEPLTETGAKPVEVEPQPPQQMEAKPPSVSVLPQSKNMSELLAKEHLAIQNKKRKKLDLILTLFAKQAKNGSTSSPQVTNDEVEKFLHVSDATATRYLSILEKEGKIKKNEKSGKKGKWVSYLKM